MQYVELTAVIAVLQLLFFGAMTGKARRESGLKAPAMTGHKTFERMYRVQVNTLEVIVVLLPCLFIAAKYWPQPLVAGLGIIYIIGRFAYWRGYISSPEKRTIGFLLSIVPTILLAILAITGILISLIG